MQIHGVFIPELCRQNNNIVTCKPITTQRLHKRIPVTTHTYIARQRRDKHAFTTTEEAVFMSCILARDVFSVGPCSVYISKLV